MVRGIDVQQQSYVGCMSLINLGKEVETKFATMGYYNIGVRRIPSAAYPVSTATSSADAEVVGDIENERTH